MPENPDAIAVCAGPAGLPAPDDVRGRSALPYPGMLYVLRRMSQEYPVQSMWSYLADGVS
jgi:hypothetical protein